MTDMQTPPPEPLYYQVYRKLKQSVYYDHDLYLKYLISKYECIDAVFSQEHNIIWSVFNDIDNILTNKSNDGISESSKKAISGWIENIGYYTSPKSVSVHNSSKENDSSILSNITSSDKYYWHGLNYHIMMPVELFLLDALWVIYVGALLDETFEDCCYGNRVHKHIFKEDRNHYSSHLMENYAKQYEAWRDNALDSAKDLLNNGKVVDIITLDFTKCYYHIEGDFAGIANYLRQLFEEGKIHCLQLYLDLTEIIENISKKYYSIIKDNLELTHAECIENKGCENECKSILPIGLRSSGILANWHLRDFDASVRDNLRPYYYGRYVDDCIFIFAREKSSKSQESLTLHDFIKERFVKYGILEDVRDGEKVKYSIVGKTVYYSHLEIQDDKILLLHLDPDHSSAPLDLFREKLRENSSVFHYLPEEPLSKSSETSIYNLVFSDGSTNTLRNIKGFNVNTGQLSISLAKQIQQISLCRNSGLEIRKLIQNLFKDMRGNNYLAYIRTWEKMFSLLFFSGEKDYLESVKKLMAEICQTISNLTPSSKILEDVKSPTPECKTRLENLGQRLKEGLYNQLLFAVSQPLSLFSTKKQYEIGYKLYRHYLNCRYIISSDDEALQIPLIAGQFRHANLFPHHHMSYPLLNYIKEYDGDLYGVDVFSREFKESNFSEKIAALDDDKIKLRPKFIHLYELQLYFALENLLNGNPFTKLNFVKKESQQGNSSDSGTENTCDSKPLKGFLKDAESVYYDCILRFLPGDITSPVIELIEELWEQDHSMFPSSICATKIHINTSPKRRPDPIRIGIVNLPISDSTLSRSYHPEKSPDISLRRWTDLAKILNTAVKNRCDLVVFPELSIPHRWLSWLSMWSRQHQVGLVFGMEYIFGKKNQIKESDKDSCSKYTAFNTTVALLPFDVEDYYKSCSISIRVKNHYSPDEKSNLQDCNYLLPEKEADVYHLYNWKGTQFTIYNCFELADIRHRSLFRSDLDYIIGCSYNRDTHYFNDIIDSVSRDLHCYVIYSNTANYGCSRIIQPTKSETRNIAYIGGGSTPTLITGDLEIAKLRNFQAKPTHGGYYKPLPPGFDSCRVMKRGK